MKLEVGSYYTCKYCSFVKLINNKNLSKLFKIANRNRKMCIVKIKNDSQMEVIRSGNILFDDGKIQTICGLLESNGKKLTKNEVVAYEC